MARLAYDRAGSGPPLVLLHPLGADRHVWAPVLPRLVAERDCIAVDLPGFGDSAALDGEVPPRALARAVMGLLSELGLERGRAHVAGNSLGGWVALELAQAGAAASVTAIAPAGLWREPLGPKPEVGRWLARTATPVVRGALVSARVRRSVLRGVVAHPERMPGDAAAGLVRAYARAPGFSAVNRAMRAGVFTALADIDVPVTLVWPECDRLVARAHRVPPGVTEIDLPGCGHIPMWDDPDAVAAALLRGSAAAVEAGSPARGS